MCQFDVSQYIYPCHTFVYRLTQRCRQPVQPCRKINLRQKHVRKEGPCRHPEVCDWCLSVSGLAKEAVMNLWNSVRFMSTNLHTIEAPVLPVQWVPSPDGGSVEYNGTTYYVPLDEFQQRILPNLLKEAEAKRSRYTPQTARLNNKTGDPVIVVSPDRKSLETSTAVANLAPTPSISRTGGVTPGATAMAPGYHPLSGNGILSLEEWPLCDWKSHGGFDRQGRFIITVSHRWDKIQQLCYPEFIRTQPVDLMYGGYHHPMFQQRGNPQ